MTRTYNSVFGGHDDFTACQQLDAGDFSSIQQQLPSQQRRQFTGQQTSTRSSAMQIVVYLDSSITLGRYHWHRKEAR
jgi:hypothetical protein